MALRQVRQTNRQESRYPSDTRQLLGSMPRRNEHDPNITVGSRRPREGRMLRTGGTAGKGTTSPWSADGGTEGNDQGPSLLERRTTGKATLGIRKGEQESADGTSSVADELSDCGMAEAHEDHDEFLWRDEQTGARRDTCSIPLGKNVHRRGGTHWDPKCHNARRNREPLR